MFLGFGELAKENYTWTGGRGGNKIGPYLPHSFSPLNGVPRMGENSQLMKKKKEVDILNLSALGLRALQHIFSVHHFI